MPSISCSYTRVPIGPTATHPNGHIVLRPWLIAGVALPGQARRLPCTVCLDTGADSCVFPLSLAHRLGLNVLDMPSSLTMGVGSSAVVYHAQVNVEIGFTRAGEQAPFHVIRLDIITGFTEGLDAQGIGLLGQSGFFDRHDVLFSQRQGFFTIDTGPNGYQR